MQRLLLTTVVLTGFCLSLPAVAPTVEQCSAAEPAGSPPAPADTDEATKDQDEAALNQQILANKYREFEAMLLQLAQRMERSSRPEDRERAAVLKQALEKAATANISNKFDKLISTLKASKSASLNEIQIALGQNKTLAEDLTALLDLLRTQNREESLKAEKLRLEQLIKMLDKAIIEQKTVRGRTEVGRTDKATLVREQQKVTRFTGEIAKALDKNQPGANGKSDSKDGAKEPKNPGKPQDGSKSDPKDGGKSQDGSKSDPKDGGKSQDGSKSDPKDGGKSQPGQPPQGQQGQPPQGQQPQSQQGQKNQHDEATGKQQIQDAVENQKRAESELEKEKRDQASKAQDDAIKELVKARKKLEEILKQLREEEQERTLADLQQRCERMLQMQIAVREDTGRVHDDVYQTPDHKPTRAHEQKSLELAKREDLIVQQADKAVQILEAEGSAVAFPEVFHQVRDDMKNIARRLRVADVGTVTQSIEDDVIASLKDMIEALKKKQQEMKDRKNPPPQNGQPSQPPPQSLIDAIAELKMIRAMQLRVNARTVTYAREYEGEQLPVSGSDKLTPQKVDMVRKELRELAERQQKIAVVVHDIATGKNR